MDNYISVREFAEMVGVSVQSIYKRMKKADDPIRDFIKIKEGKKVISVEAIEIIYDSDFCFEEIKEEKKNEEDTEAIKLLKAQIEHLQKEIEFKNKQLEDLTEQLKASSERETNYQTLLNQQQQLTAIEKQKVLMLEEKKKKGLFNRFKRDKNNEE